VACADNYALNVAVTGLGTGKTVVLSNTPTDSLTFSTNTTTAFTNRLTNASSYSVAVTTQPTNQTCTVTNGTGTMTTAGATVSVACTDNTYPVNVTVTGLRATYSVTLKNNLSDTLTFTGNTTTAFGTRLTVGSSYSVTYFSKTTTQTCAVTNGVGTMTAAGASVSVSCTPP
jgi:predicted secreted protein